MKNFKPINPRILIFSFKYMVIPLIVSKIASYNTEKEAEENFRIMADKYNFGYL